MKDGYPHLNWKQLIQESSRSISVNKLPARETIAFPQALDAVTDFFKGYVKELKAEEGTNRAKTTPKCCAIPWHAVSGKD